VQLNNAVGDTISVTATLTTSDPNENGEGEPLQVTSSGGEINATISAYSVPTPFSYSAAVANETISGTIIGFDGDEACTSPAKLLNWSAGQTAGVARTAIAALVSRKANHGVGCTVVSKTAGIG
jgi:hypothetical protein